jgi:hypothetical protein
MSHLKRYLETQFVNNVYIGEGYPMPICIFFVGIAVYFYHGTLKLPNIFSLIKHRLSYGRVIHKFQIAKRMCIQ